MRFWGPGEGARGGVAFEEIVDDGAIPGTLRPPVFTNGAPTSDASAIAGIQIAYSDLDPASDVAGWTLEFFESYSPCSLLSSVPTGTVTVSGLPSNGCWTVDLDLQAASGSGEQFTIQHDGGAANPGYDGVQSLDSFGVSWRYTGTANAGPMACGDPADTDTGWVSGSRGTGSSTAYGEAGGSATCLVFGDLSVANDSVALSAHGMPANQFGVFITGLVAIPPATVNSGNG